MKNFIILLILALPLHAGMPIDTVLSFTPGSGQDFGHGADVFPENIFGLPSTNASETVPAAAETDILSLGLKGEIIVGVKDYYIVDGDGADFTVFENAFLNQATEKVFAEPAVISVSVDGIHFVEFPFDSLSLAGLAGKTPTHGDQNPYNPEVSGGDSYDLADLGLNQISWIKIRDVATYASLDEDSPYYYPLVMLSGFDLDAVLGINIRHKGESVRDLSDDISINKYSDYLIIETPLPFEYKLYNLAGKAISKGTNSIISTNSLHKGMYILQILYKDKVLTKKLIL